jgi:hypothetical protein
MIIGNGRPGVFLAPCGMRVWFWRGCDVMEAGHVTEVWAVGVRAICAVGSSPTDQLSEFEDLNTASHKEAPHCFT